MTRTVAADTLGAACRGPGPDSRCAPVQADEDGQTDRSSRAAENDFLTTMLGGLCAPEVELGALWHARELVCFMKKFELSTLQRWLLRVCPQRSALKLLRCASSLHESSSPLSPRRKSWEGRTSSPPWTGALAAMSTPLMRCLRDPHALEALCDSRSLHLWETFQRVLLLDALLSLPRRGICSLMLQDVQPEDKEASGLWSRLCFRPNNHETACSPVTLESEHRRCVVSTAPSL